MDHVAHVLGVAATAFVATNLDDLVLLGVLFLPGPDDARPRPGQIVLGQFLGVGALVAVSLGLSLTLSRVDTAWVGLLGLVPLALGARGLLAASRRSARRDRPAVGVAGVVTATLATGADNVSVYTPLFHRLRPADVLLTVGAFALLLAAAVAVAGLLRAAGTVTRLTTRLDERLVPLVYIGLGLIILVRSGTASRALG